MANDTTIRVRYPTGATLYTQIESPTGLVWNGSTYVAIGVTTWAAVATATPETAGWPGRYACPFPTSSAAGNYVAAIYLQAGGSPANTDTPVASFAGYWDGNTFGNANLGSFPFGVTVNGFSGGPTFRNQDGNNSPTWEDCLASSWAAANATEIESDTSRTFIRHMPNGTPMRTFTLTPDANGNPIMRS